MSVLINELKEEHKQQIETLKKVKEIGFDTEEGRALLLSAKEAFLAHLKKEDEKLYPTLRKASESDSGLNRLLGSSEQEMSNISATVIDFFDKYTMENTSGIEFARDFGKLYATLGIRIRREEFEIYTKYDQLLA